MQEIAQSPKGLETMDRRREIPLCGEVELPEERFFLAGWVETGFPSVEPDFPHSGMTGR